MITRNYYFLMLPWQPIFLLALSTELMGVAGRRRLAAQPGGLTLGFAVNLVVCEVTLAYFCAVRAAYTCKENPCLYGGRCVRGRAVPPSTRTMKTTPSTAKVTPLPRFKCVCRIGFYGNFCQKGADIVRFPLDQ